VQDGVAVVVVAAVLAVVEVALPVERARIVPSVEELAGAAVGGEIAESAHGRDVTVMRGVARAAPQVHVRDGRPCVPVYAIGRLIRPLWWV
jgi:hypothetical protein